MNCAPVPATSSEVDFRDSPIRKTGFGYREGKRESAVISFDSVIRSKRISSFRRPESVQKRRKVRVCCYQLNSRNQITNVRLIEWLALFNSLTPA